MRWLAAAALLLAPGLAWADPITIVATLAPYIGGTLAAAAATAAVFVATYGGYILAAYSVYGGIQARRKAKSAAAAARRAYNASLTDRTITTLQATPPWRVVYGRAIVGGDIVAILTSDKTGTRDNGGSYTKPDALKHIVICLAAHQCQDVHEVMIDGIAIGALDGSGWATTGEFGGKPRTIYQERTLAAGAFATFDAAPTVISAGYQGAHDTGWVDTSYSVVGNTVTNTAGVSATISVKYTATFGTVRWEKHLGLPDQLASTYLQSVVPAEWTANDRLRGLTYVVVTLDLEEARFQGGPPPLTFDVSGRLLLDTRTSTTAWGENSALVIYDWLTAEWGFGIDPADVDTASINAAANACDAVISLTVGPDTSSGATYTANGACTSDAPQEAVLEELAQSMAGLVTHTGGLWVVNAGAYTAPVLALTENLQAGAIEVVQAGAAYADIFNGVRGRMIEHGRAVESDFDPYSNSAYVTDDGDELWTDITLPWTDNRARARNLARIFTEQARESLVIRYPAQLHAWPLQVGDRVTVTSAEYGWSAKVFRVTDWQWSDQSAVLLTLQEDGASIYDLADAATADSLPNTGLPNPYAVPALTGMAAASGSAHVLRQGDGSFLPRVWVTWDAISSAYVTQGGRVEIRWRRVGVDAVDQWRSVGAGGGSTGEYLVGAGAGDQVIIAAGAVNSLGARGVETIISHVVAGDTAAPAVPSGYTLEVLPGVLLFSWLQPPEADFDLSQKQERTTTSEDPPAWDDAGRVLWQGRASERLLPWPADGTHQMMLRHVDRSGNASAPMQIEYTVTGLLVTDVTRSWFRHDGTGAQWERTLLDPENDIPIGLEDAFWIGDGGTLAIAGIAEALATAENAAAVADGKIASYYEATAPTLITHPGLALGDIWFDTDDGKKQYRWDGAAWVLADDTRIGDALDAASTALGDAAFAQATADGKVQSRSSQARQPPPQKPSATCGSTLTNGYRIKRWDGDSLGAGGAGYGRRLRRRRQQRLSSPLKTAPPTAIQIRILVVH
jgi:hypothetical protein